MRRLIVISLLASTGLWPPHTAKEIAAVATELLRNSQVSEAEWTREVLAMIHETPAPRDVALAVSHQLWDHGRDIVLADALRNAPDDAGLIRALVPSRGAGLAMNAAFGPVTFVGAPAIRAAWRGRPVAEIADSAAWQISALVNLGRPADAIAVFDTLPDPVRAVILGRKLGEDEFPHYVQLDLAISAAVTHDADRALQFLAAAPSGGDSRPQLVRALVANDGADPYDVLAKSMHRDGVWAEAAAIVADRGGYGSFAAVLRDSAGHSTRAREQADAALPLLPSALRFELQATLEHDRRDRAALRARARVTSDNGVMSLLRGTPANAFEERPLPARVEHDGVTVVDCRTWKGPWPDYTLRRCEARGEERLALGIWSELDPMGMHPGAWWLYHSTDAGATWEKVYTGVRETQSYSLVKESHVPMFDGGGVRIEADVLENGAWIAKPLRRVLVALSWTELRRDSDGDGVPDLVEERLVTDPHNHDTDGDGIEDGADPQPQIPSVQTSSVESQLIGRALGRFPATWTTFFIGDRSLVAGSGVKARLVVLTRDEADAYRAKFGMTAFGDLSFLIVRRDGKKATLYVDYGSSGSTYEFEKIDGVWKMYDRGGWVS